MNRLLLIARERRTMLVIALAALTIAGVAAIGSGAFYTTTSTNPGNTFTAGTMTMYNGAADTAVLTAANMFPGQTTTGYVTIGNTNSFDARLALAVSSIDETAGPGGTTGDVLSPDLWLTVTDQYTGATLYSNWLADAAGADTLFTGVAVAPGVAHEFRFDVTMADNGAPDDVTDPSSGDNIYQGATSTVGFTWVLETTH